MEAKELRINNLVSEYGIPITVTPNLILKLYQIEISGMICIDISPIELTEEWLLRFGFEIKRGFATLEDFKLGFITTDENYQFEYSIGMIGKWILNDIKYVHQLQNLYWCLTGNELEIKTK